ncbi:NnrS family protein [Solirhodobacter olei]|uniref:NnrS family protein n=1 Tax=Solirhodobacter olei TaxID=2493082 RepID=UPI000FDB6AEF|nr:NnrS family protein [Solirhodobacter olei]
MLRPIAALPCSASVSLRSSCCQPVRGGDDPLCLCVRMGRITPARPFDPMDRHTDEILFGYAGAVLAGFLSTEAPNWTGRMPAQALLLAVAGVSGLGRPVR